MRMRKIIQVVEGIADETDEELFYFKHCDALAVKIHRLFFKFPSTQSSMDRPLNIGAIVIESLIATSSLSMAR